MDKNFKWLKKDISILLNKSEIKELQKVIGTFLFYSRAIDNTMAHALNTLASAQANGTQQTKKAMTHFLQYCATHPNAKIRFKASDMILKIHSDASYLTAKEARSRVGGFLYLGNKHDNMINGPIHIIAKIIKNVVSSAAEAEIAGVFTNAKEAVPIIQTLKEMGHPQQPVEIITDNSTASNILNNNCN